MTDEPAATPHEPPAPTPGWVDKAKARWYAATHGTTIMVEGTVRNQYGDRVTVESVHETHVMSVTELGVLTAWNQFLEWFWMVALVVWVMGMLVTDVDWGTPLDVLLAVFLYAWWRRAGNRRKVYRVALTQARFLAYCNGLMSRAVGANEPPRNVTIQAER